MPQWLLILSWISIMLGLVTAGLIAADIVRQLLRRHILRKERIQLSA
ncbi:MAG: hypothetical protein ACREFO_10510 [Acetobacteraceae bacterium]